MKVITDKKTSLKIENGLDIYKLQVNAAMDLQLYADKGTNAELLITYAGVQADLHISVNAEADCELRILFWSQMMENVAFHLEINAQNDSHIHIGIADLQSAAADYEIHSELCYAGAQVYLSSVCLANHKHWRMNMVHKQAHTHSKMENFAVTEDNGDFRMEASGTIQKGAYESSSHQTSRVLTMSENHQCEVLPILYIDEDEVKASHATTVGQPDAGQLYYLKSRGLNTKQALGLLKLGYLLPIADVISDADIQKKLRRQIEEKVMRHD